MISLICFILTLAGSINWFCIGVLQYDFVAGLFGSQANVFSRIIYAIIGISSIWLVVEVIKGKGRLKVAGKNNNSNIIKNNRANAMAETSKMYDENNNFNGFGDNFSSHTPYTHQQSHREQRNYHSHTTPHYPQDDNFNNHGEF